MAIASSALITPSLALNQPRRLTCLSSSSSVFFSSKRVSLGLSVERPRTAKKRGLSCTCLFGLGVPELVVIAGVATLLFGPSKLPQVGRSIGKTLKSFQQAAKEFESELKKEDEPSAESSSETLTPVSDEKITPVSEEKITAVSEEKKQEDKVPTANGSS